MKTKEYIESGRAQLADKFRGAQDKISDTARNVRHVTNDYVRENPWRIIAVVAIAACVTGWLLNAARED